MAAIQTLRHYAIVLNGAPAESFRGLDPKRKYHALQRYNQLVLERLRRLLADHDVPPEACRWGQPTVFDTLFIDATPQAAALLRDSPDVNDIQEVGGLPLSLHED